MRNRFLIFVLVLFLLLISFNPLAYADVQQTSSYGNSAFTEEQQKIDPAFFTSIKQGDESVSLIVELNKPCVVEAESRNFILKILDPISGGTIKNEQQSFLHQLEELGLSFEVGYSFQKIFNGISIELKGKDIGKLLELRDVKHVYENKKFKADLYNALDIMGAEKVWNLNSATGTSFTGKGIIVGVIDTGIDYNNPDLGGGFGPQYKVIGGYNFVDNNNDPMDDNSHGTHVAGIISTNGRLKGVAPDSKLMAYKVLDKDGYGQTSWIIAAMERALKDKCDIVNLSIGLDDIWLSQNDPEVEAANNLAKSGVVVVNSAGNSGTRTASLQTPISGVGIGNDVISVAASSIDTLFKRSYTIYLKTSYGEVKDINSQAAELPLESEKLFPENNEYEIVDCGLGENSDFKNKNMLGKVALIERGDITFSDKLYNAEQAGAIGAIIYNNKEGVVEPVFGIDYDTITEDPSKAFIPCAIISLSDGNYIKYLLGDQLTISFKYNEVPFDENVTYFSSQGPSLTQTFQPVFKPEITAPGENIYSTVLNDKYDWYSGTSMSSPMIAGAVALLKQAHPDWSVEDLKDVLMNTADILMNPPQGNMPTYGAIPVAQPISFTYQGAGRVNIFNAINTPALIDPAAFAFQSIQTSETFNFNLRNTKDEQETFSIQGKILSLNYTAGVNFKFSENSITLNPNEIGQFSVKFTIDDSLSQGEYEGAIFLQNEKGTTLHIPFYFFRPTIPFPQTVKDFSISSESFSPNVDGLDDDLNITMLVGKGTTSIYGGPANQSTDNYLYGFKLEILDNSGTDLGTIFDDSNFYITPSYYEFVWNGQDVFGRNFLKNGSYILKLTYVDSYSYTYDSDSGSWDLSETNYGSKEINFTVEDTPQIIKQEPAQILIPSVGCIPSGGLFTLPIDIKDTAGVGKISFSLTYDPSIFNVNDVINDGFFSENWFNTVFESNIDNSKGVLNVSIKSESGQQRSGSGSLLTLLLTAKAAGSSNISFDNISALDPSGNELQIEGTGTLLNVLSADEKPSITLNGNQTIYTNQSQYNISGTTNLIDYILINNAKIMPDTSGKFECSLDLQEGDNTVLIRAQECTGGIIILTRQIILDTMPPDIYISLPNISTSESNTTIISGKVDDSGTGVASLNINGNAISFNTDGTFYDKSILSNGINIFDIYAEDKAGNKAFKTIQVIYNKPVLKTLILQISNPMMIVDGKEMEIDPGRGTVPIIKNSRTLLPIRTIVETLGGTVSWDAADGKVTVELGSNSVEMWIGKPQATVNGQTMWIDDTNHDVVPEIINSRTMLPLRFISENLGAKINWDSSTNSITITYGPA